MIVKNGEISGTAIATITENTKNNSLGEYLYQNREKSKN